MLEFILGIDPGINGGVCLLKFFPKVDNFSEDRIYPEVRYLSSDMSVANDKYRYSFPTYLNKIKGELEDCIFGCIDRGIQVNVYLEKPQFRAHEGLKGLATSFKNYGYIIGVLEAYDVEYTLITPQQWKKKLGLICHNTSLVSSGNLNKNEAKRIGKELTINFVKEKFPKLDLFKLTPHKKQKQKHEHDGMADATAIAYYGLLNLLEKGRK